VHGARGSSCTEPWRSAAIVDTVATEVRTIDAAEVSDWVSCMDLGFLRQRADVEAFARYYLEEIDLDRSWASIDDRRVVGTLRSFATRLVVPGPGEASAAALTNVTVAPTHRRRGLLTQMILHDLAASVERGEALGILIASEYPIYGRFGYGPAAYSAVYSVDTESARFSNPPVGRVELVDLEALRKEAPALYDSFRRAQPGAIERNEAWWDRRLHRVEVPGEDPPQGFSALYRSASGGLEGYLCYQAQPKWHEMRPEGNLVVEELVSSTPAAYEMLWRFCCEVDLVSSLSAANRCVEEPLPWLLQDARAVRQTARFDFLWVRILDVCAALSARCYAAEGSVVLEVLDPLGYAAGRYRLDGGPSGSVCVRTGDTPDIVLPVDALGAAYLGGSPLRLVAGGGRAQEETDGALASADAMLRSAVAPWCSTWF
jgi:predicted acetyltransferase